MTIDEKASPFELSSWLAIYKHAVSVLANTWILELRQTCRFSRLNTICILSESIPFFMMFSKLRLNRLGKSSRCSDGTE